MTLPVILRDEAAADVASASHWYDRQRSGLGDQFLDSLNQLLNDIEAAPLAYAASYREVRRAKLRRFPYIVYYRVLDDRIEVLGVLHGSRDPRVWQRRS